MLQPNIHADDNTLVTLLQQGDLQAFDKLYWKYHSALYNNVLKLTRDTGAAEDIVQEIFITLWQKRMLIETSKSISGWLFVISYNKAINWQRKKLLETQKQQNITVEEDASTDTYNMQMKMLEDAMEKLSPQKRRVFELCKLQGKTYKETAEELNISSHTVKEYLSGAMASVKEYAITHPEYTVVLPVLFIIT
ncbi:RNA polymerase sigma factor [Ferruginibacter sp.]|nr:sigma-70 family RNA polymerase sigma factor [Ferruginibacter sp.]